jgi:glycosyltransferase involved in cell wall biosynthesis
MTIRGVQEHKPVRICHIISGDLWGGAEAVVYHLNRGLKKLGAQTSVITFNKGKLEVLLRNSGLDVSVVDEKTYSLFRLVKEVRRRVVGMGATVMHSHGYKENMVAFAVSRLVPSVRLVATQHGWPEVYGRKFDLKYRFLNYVNLFITARFFHHFVCVSEDMREIFIRRYGKAGEKAEVIRNGMDVYIDINEKKRGKNFAIGSCGRFVPVKDYPLLVAVAAYIRERNRNVLFRIAGDGPELSKVRALVRAHNLEASFSCVGAVDDMEGFYQGLDVYINTSIHEGIPMSILEAMLHSLPVVAPRVGGLDELITNGVEGSLIDERDPSRYGDQCLRLMKDPGLYDLMSRAALTRVKTFFSAERMAREYFAMYSNLAP